MAATASAIYKRVAELPVFTSASFISRTQISIESSIRDHVNNTKRIFLQEALVNLPTNDNPQGKAWLSTPLERGESVIARVISSSGRRIALLKETAGPPKKRYVEVWNGDEQELILETTSRHGSFYGDATFSSLCFSQDEKSLLYTAEANTKEEDPKDPFKKFAYDQSYGETFIGRRSPTLFWLRWAVTHTLKPAYELRKVTANISGIPNNLASHKLEEPPIFSLGQGTFASRDGLDVLATAYLRSDGDRKLGIVYCANRPSVIIKFSLPKLPEPSLEEVSKEEKGQNAEKKQKQEVEVDAGVISTADPSRSPRVWFPPEDEPSSAEFGNPVAIWLSSAKEPHGSCGRLHLAELTKGKVHLLDVLTSRILVDTVWESSKPVDNGGFPGLYVNQLPSNPVVTISDKPHAICVSNWGCYQVVVAVPLRGDTGAHDVIRVPCPPGMGSVSFANSDGKCAIVVSATHPTAPNEIFVANDISDVSSIEWLQVTKTGDRVKDLTEHLAAGVIDIKDRYPVQTIHLTSKRSKDAPLITMPHGGPHSVTPFMFSVELAALANCGYSISCPNYTGSLGYGQKWVEALLGKIGRLDIDDVMASIDTLVDSGMAKKSRNKQLYMGGSHGGFIGAHVIAQFPTHFSACVLRNPVINVGSMVSTTDIPDWTTVECGVPYDPSSVLTPASYSDLYGMSPIQYVDKVETPVLLRIGDVDQRVPPSQGKEYYHLLKARGMGERVQMLWFPENGHPLDKVEAERVGWDAQLAWFQKYGSNTSFSG
ncbi:hypothetical protein PIIN_07868 [Serendipita indica DSM 11827]|uniref:acylaminoacyl-peptidase n=1 Tax=Serendipita indica (strain DSM 11827) TaxID=1109443 RepID=G4TRG8_SERID|nr:hypothetical protein PIIN_07868 [Serendipita indica DSM 11827]